MRRRPSGRDERGDVPGWVLITVMTAGLVGGLWAFAGDAAAARCCARRCARSAAEPGRAVPVDDQRGSAVVDFVLVLVVLLPLFLGILQVALVLHVRNTLTVRRAPRAPGTRPPLDRGPGDAAALTRRRSVAPSRTGSPTTSSARDPIDGAPASS